ncbi:hypothetical protein MY11210_002795 [Beauveria gryllotalpidicola]
MRHHVDLRLLGFSPVSAAFQLELPDSQLGCHGRLSSRHGLDSGDSDQSHCNAWRSASLRDRHQAIERQKYSMNNLRISATSLIARLDDQLPRQHGLETSQYTCSASESWQRRRHSDAAAPFALNTKYPTSDVQRRIF